MLVISNRVSAIILSGGNGVRLQKYGVPKQLYEIEGTPIFIYSIKTYDSIDEIDEIILVVNKKFIFQHEKVLKQYQFRKPIKIVLGGEFRHQSIQNGLSIIDHDGIVVIQNGVNPNTPAKTILECIKLASESGAVSAYIPAFHTVFESEDGEIKKVLERRSLSYTCDPQVFKVEIIKKAFYFELLNVKNDIPVIQLVRNIGQKIKLILSDEYNIKISSELDVLAFEGLLDKNTVKNSFVD